MREKFEEFCTEALGTSLDSLGNYTIKRQRAAPRARAYLQVVVRFEDTYTRDEFFALGPNLAGFRDQEEKPTCGLRLHIPTKLMPTFKTLEAFGFDLKRIHKDKVRKHINCLLYTSPSPRDS